MKGVYVQLGNEWHVSFTRRVCSYVISQYVCNVVCMWHVYIVFIYNTSK